MTNKQKLPAVAVASRPGLNSDISPAAAKRWNPDIQAAAESGGEASISILDPIGADPWGEGVTAKRVAAALRSIGGADVVVNINSPGGDFFEGLAIYNLLREYEGQVTVRILGIAASAASIIAMAADRVLIGRAAFLMIHNTWVVAAGNRHDFRDVADWLEPFDQAAAGVYSARTGLPLAEVAQLLDAETWIAGEAAVARGFADDLLTGDQVAPSGAKAAAELSVMAAKKKLDLLLAGRVSRSERREIVAALTHEGTLDAAHAGMSRAAVSDLAAGLEKLQSI